MARPARRRGRWRAYARGDGWPPPLAGQTVAGLVSPGDLVVDLDGDDAVRVAAHDQRCRYLPVGGAAGLRHPGWVAGQARLVTLRWPRRADPPADPPAAVDLLCACRRLLVGAGYVAVALIPPAGDAPFVDPALAAMPGS